MIIRLIWILWEWIYYIVDATVCHQVVSLIKPSISLLNGLNADLLNYVWKMYMMILII